VGLNVGDVVQSSAAADIKPGNCLPLANIPVGTIIHNIELYPGKRRPARPFRRRAAQLMAKDGDLAQIRLPSGEFVWFAPTAPPSSARSAISIMRTSISARPAAPVTWASARPSAALL
jgi:ribosomal protein L2